MIGDMVGTMEELNLQQCVLSADGWFVQAYCGSSLTLFLQANILKCNLEEIAECGNLGGQEISSQRRFLP